LYPTVWNDGHTLYPSAVAAKSFNQPQDPHPGLQGRDSLAEALALAKAQDLQVIPWFEFGFMAPAESEWVAAHPDWLTQNAQGETIWLEGKTHPRVWLNPLHAEVQELITALALEIVTNYDVDGIQFDDHFGYPSSLGYDRLTVDRYRQATGHNPPPPPTLDPNQNCVSADPDWQAWTNWRSDQITAYLETLVQTLKAAKPDLMISISPNPQTFSKNCFLADWQQWQEKDLMDQLVLQIYREKQTAFERELTDPSVEQAKQQIPVVVGILSGLKNRPVPLDRLQRQTQWAQENGFAGVAYFFYESLWNLIDPVEQTLEARQAFFQQFRQDQ
ncbi:MAG: family 10 glycosylhydrolase, partial [Synechocystis sp.]